jgi:hypothetical protein
VSILPTHSQILDHPDRARIEYDLARGVPVRALSRKYEINIFALYRFRKKLPPQLRAAAMAQRLKAGADLADLKLSESESILQNLALLRARLFLNLDAAMEANDPRLATYVSDAIGRNIALTARYLGEFSVHENRAAINILISEDYLSLRTDLLRALANFPEARRAVAAALHEREARMVAEPKAIAAAPPLIEGTVVEHEVVADV